MLEKHTTIIIILHQFDERYKPSVTKGLCEVRVKLSRIKIGIKGLKDRAMRGRKMR